MDLTTVDKDGFLQDASDWTPTFAEEVATGAKIALTEQHWQVIHGVRSFYAKTGVSPTMRMLVKLVKNEVSKELGSSIVLAKLFTHSSNKLVAQMSGLPKPSDCI